MKALHYSILLLIILIGSLNMENGICQDNAPEVPLSDADAALLRDIALLQDMEMLGELALLDAMPELTQMDMFEAEDTNTL